MLTIHSIKLKKKNGQEGVIISQSEGKKTLEENNKLKKNSKRTKKDSKRV